MEANETNTAHKRQISDGQSMLWFNCFWSNNVLYGRHAYKQFPDDLHILGTMDELGYIHLLAIPEPVAQ